MWALTLCFANFSSSCLTEVDSLPFFLWRKQESGLVNLLRS